MSIDPHLNLHCNIRALRLFCLTCIHSKQPLCYCMGIRQTSNIFGVFWENCWWNWSWIPELKLQVGPKRVQIGFSNLSNHELKTTYYLIFDSETSDFFNNFLFNFFNKIKNKLESDNKYFRSSHLFIHSFFWVHYCKYGFEQ